MSKRMFRTECPFCGGEFSKVKLSIDYLHCIKCDKFFDTRGCLVCLTDKDIAVQDELKQDLDIIRGNISKKILDNAEQYVNKDINK